MGANVTIDCDSWVDIMKKMSINPSKATVQKVKKQEKIAKRKKPSKKKGKKSK